ncbi:MAG TPA: HIT domain-containing protein [Candidatus Eisenbacteria bacterium]|nr:HIT domain-containing protein [Candidatus Eisenbacteria bacterium]
MYNHKPKNYTCPFCELAKGRETPQNKREDIVYQDSETMVFLAPTWWENNSSHIIVVPKEHGENIYDISETLLCSVYGVVKRVAKATRAIATGQGTSVYQHNEPAGGQDVWHFHVNLFSEYTSDSLKKDKRTYVQQVKENLSKE